MYKKLGAIILGLLLVVGLSACTNATNEVDAYYVAIDINPSIEFVVDGEDNVESFIFLNDDAAALCADLDFIGMNVDEAVTLFIDTATEAGYIDPEGDDNAVLITVIGDDEEDEQALEQIRTRLREHVQAQFMKRNISAAVISENYTQGELVTQANELGVSPGKLKLALSAQVVDETLVLDELLELPVKQILAKVNEAHAEAWQTFTETRQQTALQEKTALIAEHQVRLQAFIAANPELTDEQVEALMAQHQTQNQVREETQSQWQERINQWRQERANDGTGTCTQDCPNSDNPDDESDLT